MTSSAWRWFPLGLFASMAFVFAVNGYMVYVSLVSFPGAAGQDGFDLSNGYDRVLQTERDMAALGWRVEATVDPDRHPVLRLTDKTGAPLAQPQIDAHAERPLGPTQATALVFHATGDGGYTSDTTLFSGQWDLMLTVREGDHTYTTTRRVVVR